MIAPDADLGSGLDDLPDRLARLERENLKLRKINRALMDRVERSMDVQGNAFSLFQTSVVLGQVVRDRTAALTDLNARLRQEIGERLAIEHALREAKTEAERANQSKTRFLAAASHDLLQPLNAARLFAAALLERRLSARNRKLAESVGMALDAVDDLLNALLDISKLDAGRVRPDTSVFTAESLLAELAEESASIARARGLAFHFVPCRAEIASDRRLLGRIVRNFLSNAIRYTDQGRVLLGCVRRGPMLRIGVWDTGPGIPPECLPIIFDEFHQLGAPRRDREKGLGLGLAIVERIAHVLEHPLWVRSRVGHGSCFAIDVPRAARLPSLVPTTPGLTTGAGALPVGAGVLVIDDEPTICLAMATLLGSWSFQVVTASSANEAVERLRDGQHPIDLIIADYHLAEGPSGLTAIARVQAALAAPVPVLIVTADRSSEPQQSGRSHGYPLLNKPVKPAQLRALVTHLLAEAAGGSPQSRRAG